MNYSLLHDAYFGSGGFATGAYLTRHKRESEEDYRFRCENAYYLNYFAPIVNALVDPIFKRKPQRDYKSSVDDVLRDFLQDVDGGGTSIDTFMKRAAITAKVYGVSFIVVDMAQDNNARNMAELRRNRAYPYLRILLPYEINGSNNYGIDQSGNLTYIEFREVSGISEGTVKYQYCRYARDGWRKTGDDLAAAQGSYNLGRVPVIPLFSRLLEQKTMLPNPDMMPIAAVAKAIYNNCSWLGEILRNQTFPLLTIPSLDAKEMTIGNNNALGYSPDSSHQPDFIAPPSDPASILQAQIASLIQEMYRMASLSFMQSSSSAEKVSGVARQWEFERTNQQLANFARSISKAEEAVMNVFARYLNTDIDYTVTYPDDFGITDVESELKQAQEVLDLGLTDVLRIDVLKKVITAYLPNAGADRTDELVKSAEKEEQDRIHAEKLYPDIQPDNEPPGDETQEQG
ncbi:hypothetical protein [Mitsuokella multacida]|uniref:hypothetical protein n=1 Tax=Mitsuokella multacida TaxID=52226 RepID=UPI003D061C1F